MRLYYISPNYALALFVLRRVPGDFSAEQSAYPLQCSKCMEKGKTHTQILVCVNSSKKFYAIEVNARQILRLLVSGTERGTRTPTIVMISGF